MERKAEDNFKQMTVANQVMIRGHKVKTEQHLLYLVPRKSLMTIAREILVG